MSNDVLPVDMLYFVFFVAFRGTVSSFRGFVLFHGINLGIHTLFFFKT